MGYYKQTPPPHETLASEVKIPKELMDFPQIIAEKQARKLGARPLIIDSENPAILKALQEFHEVNRIHEQLVTIEEIASLYGQVIIMLDKFPGEVPRLSFADPYMLSQIGKFYVEEKTATIYKYIVKDTKTYPVLEVGTPEKVKRTGYLPNKDVDTGQGMKGDLKELEGVDIYQIEEKNHNLGCLPIIELRNKQKGVHPLQDPGSGKPQLATGYPVQGLIKMAYHTLKQIGKNMLLVKPKIIGDFTPQDMARLINKPGEMRDLYDDFLISLNTGSTPGQGKSNLQILQGNLDLTAWFDGFQRIHDLVLQGCGLSPNNEAQVPQTATEINTKQSHSSETITLLKQLRIDQGLRLHDKFLIIEQLGDGKGSRPYTLSIPEEENVDKSLEIEEAKSKIEANLSNYLTEIAKIYGVSKKEAEAILAENLKVNSQVFEKTKHMQEESPESQKDSKKSKRKD